MPEEQRQAPRGLAGRRSRNRHPRETSTLRDAAFACSGLDHVCRLDELGLEVVGQRLDPDRAVLACRVVEPDGSDERWYRRCGCEGAPRDAALRRLAHEPLRWRWLVRSLSVPGWVQVSSSFPTTCRSRVSRPSRAHTHRSLKSGKAVELIPLTPGRQPAARSLRIHAARVADAVCERQACGTMASKP